MTSKWFAGAAMLSLCLGAAMPALAQEYRFAGFEGARGANATVNLRIPLGAASRGSEPTLGLTVGFGRTLGAGLDGRPIVRQMPLADFRFSDAGLANARVASFDLASPDRDRRFNMVGTKKATLSLAAAVLAAAVAACLVAGCFDGDDSNESGDSGGDTETPG